MYSEKIATNQNFIYLDFFLFTFHAHLLELVYHSREKLVVPADVHLNEVTKSMLTKQSDNWQHVSVKEEEESQVIEKVKDNIIKEYIQTDTICSKTNST